MRKWLKIVEELFKSKVNQDAIAAFTKKKDIIRHRIED